MNAKTAKLIRRFSNVTKQPYEKVKALWLSTPERYRKEFRKAMEADSQ